MFTSVTAFSTGHLSYINAPYIILPSNARSIENYGIAHSKVTYLIITYTAGTFAFNGSWNNSSTISYIYVPDTKVSAYSGRTVYPIIGQESIIEKDREFTLTIPEARYGWHNDLHWTIEENDYISIVSQGDGVATFRATGILPETDTTVTLSYQSNRGNGYFKGTKVLTVKPTPVIDFEDAEAKRICVANWGGDQSAITKVQGVSGELTYEQAAAVKNIDNKFRGNTVITAFNEFQYFTGGVISSTIDNVRFANCSKLTKIIIPDFGDHTLARWFLSGCGQLRLVKVCEGNITIRGWFVNDCRQLEFVLLPSTLRSLPTASGNNAQTFLNTPTKCAYIFKPLIPPVVGSSNGLQSANGRFYVPDESVQLYKISTYWTGVASRIFPMSQLPKDKPECPWLEELIEEGVIRDYINFEDEEVKHICCINWGDYTEVAKTETVTEEEETISISSVYTYVHKVNTTVTRTVITTLTSSRAKTEEDIVGETTTITNYPIGMTREQVTAVTSIGTVLSSNSVIISSKDMLYFTSVRSTGSIFFRNSNQQNAIFPPFVTNLADRAIQYSPNVEVCTIPPTCTSVGIYLMDTESDNSMMKALIWFPKTPPTINSYTFSRRRGNIYVPDESVDSYKAAQYWSTQAGVIYGHSQLAIDYPEYYEMYIHIYD